MESLGPAHRTYRALQWTGEHLAETESYETFSKPACVALDPAGGKYFLLSTASLSAFGYEHNLSQPAIELWNDTNHVVS